MHTFKPQKRRPNSEFLGHLQIILLVSRNLPTVRQSLRKNATLLMLLAASNKCFHSKNRSVNRLRL
jgi:hypothetical protein